MFRSDIDPNIPQLYGTSVNITTVISVISNIANFAILLGSGVAIFFVLKGAWLYMSEDAESGKSQLRNAAIGLLIFITAFFILRMIIVIINLVANQCFSIDTSCTQSSAAQSSASTPQ